MNQKGFSIPELLIVMVVTALLSSTILFFTFNFWRYGYLVEADLTTFVTRINAGDYFREAIGSSTGLVIQNSIPDPNTHNPDPAIGSNTFWVPNHAVPKNFPTNVPGTTTPLLYFKRYSINSAGTFIMNGSQPYEDEFILYINGTTKQLLVRSLANPSATGNRTITSCPPAIATPVCPADKVVASNLSSVDTRYFSRSGNTIDWTSFYDSSINSYTGPDFPVVEVLEVTLNISQKATFQTSSTTSSSTIIRVALRNT